MPNGDKRYRIQDNLGSTRVVLSADGAVYDWTNYEPFGTVLNSSGGQQNSDRLSYIGKEKDAESDLGDFGVRKYESETGRFLSIDPLWEEQRPWNVYHYSANNPIVAKDPDGKHPIVAIAVIAIAYFLSSPNVAVAPTRDTQGDKAKVEQAKRNSQQNAAIVTTTALTGGGALAIASGLATGGEVSVGKGLLKSGSNAKSGSNGAGGKKGSTDYVVTPDGVTVPKDQKVMRDGFDRAGYPSRPSEKSEPGVIHTVNTTNGKIDVRTMEGNAHHGKRAVITHPNTSSPKTPSGKATTNKSDNHIKQH